MIDTSGDQKTWLAVTSLSFDISVLELLWTLSRGFTVVLHRDEDRESLRRRRRAAAPGRLQPVLLLQRRERARSRDKYRLLLEGARVRGPQRLRRRVDARASLPRVRRPLPESCRDERGHRGDHREGRHPRRQRRQPAALGRCGSPRSGRSSTTSRMDASAISFAPGWQPNDFVLRPEAFQKRKDLMFEQIEPVRRLWRGEALPFVNGTGETVDVRILPRPVQKELPVWVTIAGNPESFVAAARAGANVLTHLLGQTREGSWREGRALPPDVARGRASRERHRHDDGALVRRRFGRRGQGRRPRADESLSAERRRPRPRGGVVLPDLQAEDDEREGRVRRRQPLARRDGRAPRHAFERYYSTSGLFGSVDTARRFVDELRDIGVDEVACLIDFGVPTEKVLAHLPKLAEVARAFKQDRTARSAACPSRARAGNNPVAHRDARRHALPVHADDGADVLLEEAARRRARAPAADARRRRSAAASTWRATSPSTVGGVVTNVYGPTETTVWSSAAARAARRVRRDDRLPDRQHEPARARQGRPARAGRPRRRAAHRRQGSRARLLEAARADGRALRRRSVRRTVGSTGRETSCGVARDGALEFLGRLDHQVKIRGHRIELGEIEARLASTRASRKPSSWRATTARVSELVAYVIPRGGVRRGGPARAPAHARARLHDAARVREARGVSDDAEPQDRSQGAARAAARGRRRCRSARAPEGGLEETIAAIWCEVLELPEVGVDTNFADVGGHSLAMVQVLGRLKERVEPERHARRSLPLHHHSRTGAIPVRRRPARSGPRRKRLARRLAPGRDGGKKTLTPGADRGIAYAGPCTLGSCLRSLTGLLDGNA